MSLMKAHRGFVLILLVSSFLLVDVSVSALNFNSIWALLSKTQTASSAIGKIQSDKISKLSTQLNNVKYAEITKNVKRAKEIIDAVLELLGYIVKQNAEDFSVNPPNAADLKSAYMKYQKNFNLTVTGQPDKETFEHLKLPRCGVPDIIDSKNTMNAGEADATPFKRWWKTGENNVTYAFEDNINDRGKLLFQLAFYLWSKETALNFTEIAEFNAADIRIDFVKWDGEGGKVGGTITNYSSGVGEMYLDGDEQLAIVPNVLMHQIGHLLGLEHSFVKESIMYPIVMQEKVELTDDDKKKIQQVKKNSNSSSASTRGTDSSGGGGGINGSVWQRNLVLGFVFMVFGIFLME